MAEKFGSPHFIFPLRKAGFMEIYGCSAEKKVLSGGTVMTFNHCVKLSYGSCTSAAVVHQLLLVKNGGTELQPHELKCPKIHVLAVRPPSFILLLGCVED